MRASSLDPELGAGHDDERTLSPKKYGHVWLNLNRQARKITQQL